MFRPNGQRVVVGSVEIRMAVVPYIEVGEAKPHNLGNPDTEKTVHSRPVHKLSLGECGRKCRPFALYKRASHRKTGHRPLADFFNQWREVNEEENRVRPGF